MSKSSVALRAYPPDDCPHCKADLRDKPIPKELQDKWYGGKTHYLRTIGQYMWDYTVAWQCPDCKGYWLRDGFETLGMRFFALEDHSEQS